MPFDDPAGALEVHRQTIREFSRKVLVVLPDAPACGAGCNFCCTLDQPSVTQLEIELLMELMRRRADLADVPDKVMAQMRHLDEISEAPHPGITDHPGEFPCVFLGQDGCCRVYEHRPLACVLAWSPDRGACEREGTAAWDPGRVAGVHVAKEAFLRCTNRTRRSLEDLFATMMEVPRLDGKPPKPPLLIMALAVMWSPETKAAIDAAAAKALAAMRRRGELP